MTRREKVGRAMADALIDWLHMMYQKQTATAILRHLITRLTERRKEFER